MHYSQFLPFVALFASSVPVGASPTAMLEGRASDDTCIKAPVSAEYDYSYYTFHIDGEYRDRAINKGLTKIGVQQHCNSNGGPFGILAMDTENWAYVPLDKVGPENPYKVKVDRCRKGKDRHVSNYRVWLCNEHNVCEGRGTACGLDRKLCPERKTKAVDFSDNLIWSCAV